MNSKIASILFTSVLINTGIVDSTTHYNTSNNLSATSAADHNFQSSIPYKQAKGRLNAIARSFMINKQNIKSPFKINQNWRQIRQDVISELKKNAYKNAHNQLVVDEQIIPAATNQIFKKLVMLESEDTRQKRKNYVVSDQISVHDAKKVVRQLLRSKGIARNDRIILLDEIMSELKKYEERDQIDIKIVKQLTLDTINKFKNTKQQFLTNKSYLQEFIAGWKSRFNKQMSGQDWGPVD